MKLILLIVVLLCCSLFSQEPNKILVDNFDNISGWEQAASDGAEISLSSYEGFKGACLKIDYKFTGAGYCGIQKHLLIKLPDDYKFTFYTKGNSPKNNLEFKLVDKTGDNVWWFNQRNFEFPYDWEKVVVRKRNIEFAWGPAGGGEMDSLYQLQIIIAASEGGKGTVYLDDLTFEKMIPPANPNQQPIIDVKSNKNNADFLFDNDRNTSWNSNDGTPQSILIDLNYLKEFGGFSVYWDDKNFAGNFSIEISNDQKEWEEIYTTSKIFSFNDYVPVKNGEARYLKLNLSNSSHKYFSIKEIKINNLSFADNYNNFYKEIAKDFRKGLLPKYLNNIQSYWTVLGASEDQKEALINEEGMIEVDKGSFSIEPFIINGNKLITWNDAKINQSLEDDYLPIPAVEWDAEDIQLNIKTFGQGTAEQSAIFVRYKISNKTSQIKSGKFLLAIRPFQVNPPWQFLNLAGGTSKIKSISYDDSIINVDQKKIIPLIKPDNFGASKFNEGDAAVYLEQKRIPSNKNIEDDLALASGIIEYDYSLDKNESAEYYFIIPFHEASGFSKPNVSYEEAARIFSNELKKTKDFWDNKLNEVKFHVPFSAQKIINVLRSNLAYILINKDGPAIQPGSRSYERAWIRDGSLTSSALLRLGIQKEVYDYLNWYAPHQFPSGKVPCVVDKRGADPVNEHDSHGELIYAILQYFIYSNDTTFLINRYGNISKAVVYIDSMTGLRKTEQYQAEDSLRFYGLMPESISHEGYSAKPMHSYWDDFFTLRGLKDAVTAANILNKKTDAEKFKKIRDEFEMNLYRSISLTMKKHNINYIPGSVELGDFDATSTTIALFPVNEIHNLPEPELKNTFEKYYDYFKKRKENAIDWINYTPYEIRAAGTFLYLGQKEKTYELLNFFFDDQRPKDWNHWAEVVWKNKNGPKFIGDMPHTWIGSDYITVARNLFGYEREGDSSLILAAGIPFKWLNEDSVSVYNFPTLYGKLDFSIKKSDENIEIFIDGNLDFPAGGIWLISPSKFSSYKINNKSYSFSGSNEIKISSLPARLSIFLNQ